MSNQSMRYKLMLTCLVMAIASPWVGGQEPTGIKWRTDYHAARKESEEKKLPVLIDVVKANCPPCMKMEKYTFTDPRMISALNGKFIPLRLSLEEDRDLINRLGVNLFPTVILAGADGVVRERLIGYQEPDILVGYMTRIAGALTPSLANKKELENAGAWETAGDYPRAINALRNILEDEKSKPLHVEADALLKKIEKRADENLAKAKELQSKGQLVEALDGFTDVRRQFAGLKASKDASELIGSLLTNNAQVKAEQRTKRVRDLLSQAQGFYKTKDYIPCLDRCEIILANFGDLPEGETAFRLASEIKNNPEWLQAATDVMTDRLGGMWLALADSYLKRGDVNRARFYLENVLRAFPGSRMAESAQIRLTQLQATMPINQNAKQP